MVNSIASKNIRGEGSVSNLVRAMYSSDRMNKRLVADDEAHVAYSIDFEAQSQHTSVAKLSVVKNVRLMKRTKLDQVFLIFCIILELEI